MPRPRLLATVLTASVFVVGLIAGYESYTERAVIPVEGDVPTIGFGRTQGVKLSDHTDPARELQHLTVDIDKRARAIGKCIGDVSLYQHEFDAYVSLAYNIGVTAFCRSTLVKKLHQMPPDYAGACAEILRWNKMNGRVLRGLTERRQGEYRRCMGHEA